MGHQNHRPSSAAIDGVRNERTTSVSNSRPRTNSGTYLANNA